MFQRILLIVVGVFLFSSCELDELYFKQKCPEKGDTRECLDDAQCGGTQVCEAINSCDDSDNPNCFEVLMWSECANPDLGQECGIDEGVCVKGKTACVAGEIICEGEQKPLDNELCNGLDDNCNGEVDEFFANESYVMESPPEPWCYSGPEETMTLGICQPGQYVCSQDTGEWVCQGDVTPAPRNCTNGRDNDCDGNIDERQEVPTDIVFFIDRSTSMNPYYEPIITAVRSFNHHNIQNQNTHIRIALIEVPGEINEQCEVFLANPNLNEAFMLPSEVEQAIVQLNSTVDNRGREPTWDCPYLAGHKDNPLELNYAENSAKIFISFTDEEGQSYLPTQVTEQKVAAVLSGNDTESLFSAGEVKFYSFDKQPSDFDEIVNATNGGTYALTNNNNSIQQALFDLLLEGTCQ